MSSAALGKFVARVALLLRIVRNIAGAVAVASTLTLFFVLAHRYSWPKIPDAVHTFPFNNHGTILYMTRLQGHLLDRCFSVGTPSTFICVFAAFSEQGLRMPWFTQLLERLHRHWFSLSRCGRWWN